MYILFKTKTKKDILVEMGIFRLFFSYFKYKKKKILTRITMYILENLN